jgi:hypothetical protein
LGKIVENCGHNIDPPATLLYLQLLFGCQDGVRVVAGLLPVGHEDDKHSTLLARVERFLAPSSLLKKKFRRKIWRF